VTTFADADSAYRALASRDRRFDGRLWYGVTSTGVYCRPVCPARTPRPENVRVFVSPAAAVASGFRACRRCRPDAQPGTRDWDHRHDLAARAVRLIAAGVVDEDGVTGLAARLHVSERHLHRTLVAEVGTGPLQLALSRRAQTARLLVDQTDLALADIAFAAGFASVRQFNDVMRREFGRTPSGLRAARGRAPERSGRDGEAAVVLRLRWRPPYDVDGVLATRAALVGADVDAALGTIHRRVRLAGGPATVRVRLRDSDDHAVLTVVGAALPDLAPLVGAVRRWLDLDADPGAVADVLGADPALAPLLAARPGVRAPASLDPWEGVLAAVVPHGVSAAAAAATLTRLAGALGSDDAATAGAGPDPIPMPVPPPSAERVAAAGPDVLHRLGLPAARARALHRVAEEVARGALPLGPDADRDLVRHGLRAIPGIGPWTVEVAAIRALGDPDAFPAGDLVLRRAAAALGVDDPEARSHRWRPWRAYAAHLLWRHAAAPSATPATTSTSADHRRRTPR
jgi:AraC family transcriptional regulator of adaptative response / DNA-3-methyladenine glycosylase II